MTIFIDEKSSSWPKAKVTAVSQRTATTISSGSRPTNYKLDGINTLGLTDLNPDRTETPTVDIVAVHGLNSTPQRCWAKDGVIWLRDFLSVSLPSARVLTFGYNSNVIIDASRARVRDHAKNLLEALKDERKTDDARPLIFICHSLGGIVVKQALVLAEQRHMNIRKSTYGICFMGTPHRGSDAAAWARIAANIAKAAFLNPKTHLLKSLKEKSQELLDLSEDFGNLIPQLQIVNCIEMKETPLVRFLGATFTRALIVDRFSATLGVGEVPLCLNTDHRTICQYSSPDDPSFKQVFGKLEDLVRDAPGAITSRYRPERPTYFVVPFVRNPEFVERGTILPELKEILGSQGDRQPRAALWGLGGIGKTTIAVEFCYRMKEQRGVSVYWAHGNSDESYRASCEDILQQASVEIPTTGKESNMAMLQLKKWLEGPESGNWILVIDNLDDLDVNFRKYIPRQRGQILFTSRDKRIVGRQDYGLAMDAGVGVDRMSDDEASLALSRLLGRSIATSPDQKAMWELLKLLDNLPLAIAQAAAFMRNTSTELSEYCRLFRESESNRQELLKELIPGSAIGSSSLTVMTTWSVTVARVEAENPLAVRLMRFMSFLGLDNIQPALVQAASQFQEESEISLVKAFGLLSAFALIDRLESSNFRMHRLVGFWTIEQMTVDSIEEGLSAALTLLTDEIPDDLEIRKDLPSYSYIAAHGMAAISRAKRASLEYRECMVPVFEVALAKLLFHLAQFEKALELSLRAVAAAEKSFGPDYQFTVFSYHFVGSCYQKMRDFTNAFGWYQKALDGEKRTLGAEDLQTLETMCSIGALFYDQGEYTKALEWFQQSLDGVENREGGDEEVEIHKVRLYNQMGSSLEEVKDYEKALELYERSLEGFEQLLGKDHPLTVTPCNNMGTLYHHHFGDYEKAMQCYQRSLEVTEKCLGREHPDTLTTVHNMAILFGDMWEDEKALEYFRWALDGSVKVYGETHDSTVCTKEKMSEFMQKRDIGGNRIATPP